MFSTRQNELRNAVGLEERHACLVSSGPDVRWLSGFTGSNASVLLMSDSAHLFTDGRYTEQATQETEGLEIHIGSGSTIDSAHTWARNHQITDLIVSAGLLTYQEGLSLFHGDRPLQYREISSFLQLLRAEKSLLETNSIRTALRITEQVVADVLPMIREGITEKELATEIDYRQRCLGAEKSSFETIVAFGKHSSLPHARPGNAKLTSNTPILLDFGCVIDGYASDMTRMIHFGKPTGEFLQTYATVHDALDRSLGAAKAGITGKDLDAVARNTFKKAGVESYFCHSLGHGVGLDIHEWPSVSSRNSDKLPEHCIITIEPGLYLPGKYGIRIENMVQLTADGCDKLNDLTTELLVL
ncbi:aminopeptidase P family protein [bacterium]|nr:aminopeptidase P family protein [bacterium]